MGTDLAGFLGNLTGGGMLLAEEQEGVDFFIHELMPLTFLGDGVYLTTTHVCTLIVMLTIMIFAVVARIKLNKAKEIPDGFQNFLELVVETLDNFVHSTMGKMGSKYVNYIGALFIFIFGVVTDLFKPLPFLFPINLIGEFATPLSLSLRLFGNVMAGTVLLALFYGLLPWFAKLGIPAFLHGYFDLFSGAIQAYVFSMLTMVFVSQKAETE